MLGHQFFDQLRRQHRLDLKIYRSAHREWRNRMLHWLLIPIECGSALLLGAIVLPFECIVLVGMGLGTLSFILAESRLVGCACWCFHALALAVCRQTLVSVGSNLGVFVVALVAWTVAWALQVGVGHWVLEKNQPNVADMGTVSYLAMVQSVLIAWSS